MQKEIRIYVKEPGKALKERTVPNTLEALQEIVGGYIETVTIASDCALVCNEEGRMLGLPRNCHFLGRIFVGTIFFVGVSGEDFTDCPRVVERWEANGTIKDLTRKEAPTAW